MKKNTVSAFLLLAMGLAAGYNASAQVTPEQKAKILSHYNLEEGNKLAKALKKEASENYEKALQMAEQNGWPLKLKSEEGVSYLTGVTETGFPVYKGNYNNDGPKSSAATAMVTHLWPGGDLGVDLDGEGMIIGMWELSGCLNTHQDLIGRVESMDGVGFTAGDSDSFGNSAHATHVAGTLIGSGDGDIAARGMAYNAELKAYNIVQDAGEALDASMDYGLLISNHSYGVYYENASDLMKGGYTNDAKTWDDVHYFSAYYQAVMAAGNDGSQGNSFLLTADKNAKNPIIVASITGAKDDMLERAASDFSLSSFSSKGPTDDLRIKPDIAMKGSDVYSTWPVLQGGNYVGDYKYENGTSMASPGVAGTLALLQQYYYSVNDEFMRAATLKALMINSADEAGSAPGPDFRFGWGVINAKTAVDVIDGVGVSSIIEENVLGQGETYTKQVTVTGAETLKVTVVWTDPAGPVQTSTQDDTHRLVNDIDVRVTEPGNIFPYFPWRMSESVTVGVSQGDNDRDNVEFVEVEPQSAGVYTITVTHKPNTQLSGGEQAYSLIVRGITNALNVNDNEFNKVTIYPNPATDVINIDMGSLGQPAKGSVVMYDLQGRIVRQFDSVVNTVNVSSLNAGMYILNINYDGYTEVKKVIVK
ncbi:S8 family serine peptidase [Flavobacterium rakeshii]|uniref:S8 family serine peptidase n=1 Tax=Flavobacterium rakeshii TaxID=1038845 RepID=UPI002E7B2F1E|nr:S8 family serine peptidase [Flavobacterium rakeshii]MEE1899251.1 S8 family serine peptidase [Flavobacterium rakeshii]